MKKNVKIKAFMLSIFAVLTAVNVLFFALRTADGETAAKFTYAPRLKLTFLENLTAFPVNDIKISIPETGYKNENFSSGDIIDIPAGTTSVTAVIFIEKYLDTAVFYIPIKEGILSAYTYYLFKKDSSEEKFIVYCETPLKENVETVIEQNRFTAK